MPRFVVYLKEQERNALFRLAEKELRAPRAQAALIIRLELERLGLLSPVHSANPTQGTTQFTSVIQEAPNDVLG